MRNKRPKKEDDYYKLDSRSTDRSENGEWDRYKKRSGYSHEKHSKHEKPYRDDMLKVLKIKEISDHFETSLFLLLT